MYDLWYNQPGELRSPRRTTPSPHADDDEGRNSGGKTKACRHDHAQNSPRSQRHHAPTNIFPDSQQQQQRHELNAPPLHVRMARPTGASESADQESAAQQTTLTPLAARLLLSSMPLPSANPPAAQYASVAAVKGGSGRSAVAAAYPVGPLGQHAVKDRLFGSRVASSRPAVGPLPTHVSSDVGHIQARYPAQTTYGAGAWTRAYGATLAAAATTAAAPPAPRGAAPNSGAGSATVGHPHPYPYQHHAVPPYQPTWMQQAQRNAQQHAPAPPAAPTNNPYPLRSKASPSIPGHAQSLDPVTPPLVFQQLRAVLPRPALRSGMTPATALRTLGRLLTPYEKSEVLGYPDVWYVGRTGVRKINGSAHNGQPNFGYDDARGDYQITLGDHIGYRYEIMGPLGRGSFGQVLKCHDHATGTTLALKIIRNKKRFQQQAHIESSILTNMASRDPGGQLGVVRMVDSFAFRAHLCITFELLGPNLYEQIKAGGFAGFPLPFVRHVASQVLRTLTFLRSIDLVHCDVKPENILLTSLGSSTVKLIDFGSACYSDQRVYTYIQSRFYRAPEVILGLPYGCPVDVWSLALVLVELVTGQPLFPGEDEVEQMACICEILGNPPVSMVSGAPRGGKFFDTTTGVPELRMKVNSHGCLHYPGRMTLEQALNGRGTRAFVDLVKRCLHWDPAARPTPEQLMQHEWVRGEAARQVSNNQDDGAPPKPPPRRYGPLGAAAAALGLIVT